jgi:hypothetical protein
VNTLTSSNELLFEVYAYAQPTDLDSMPELIGKVYSKSAAIKSTYADDELMFAHTDIKEDIKRNPTWENFLPYVTANPFGIIFGEDKMLKSYESDVYPSVGCPFGFGW